MANWYSVVGSSDYYLTQSEREANAATLTKILRWYGFSDIAIAGIFGNISHEGVFNPGQCEVNHGVPSGNYDTSYNYGLGFIQWTKPYAGDINPLLKYAQEQNKNWYDGDLQAEYITHADDALNYNLWGWQQDPAYPVTFAYFKTLNTTPTEASNIWIYNVERPGDPAATAAARATDAERWYTFIQSVVNYEPRLTYVGTDTLDYYTHWNPYWSWGIVDDETAWLGMNNCTAYAFGRWNELAQVTGFNTNWPTGNGADWVADGIAKGFDHGNVPQLGAAISWKRYEGDKLVSNHVAIVEEIQYDSNNNPVSFTISQSAFNHNQPPGRGPTMRGWEGHPWFWTDTVLMSNLDFGYGAGSFQGFVYHPNIAPVPPTPPTPPTPTGGRKMPFILYLKRIL